MGGLLSGNHRCNARLTTGQLPAIDIRSMVRKGQLSDNKVCTFYLAWSTQNQRINIRLSASRYKVEFWHWRNNNTRHEQARIEYTACHYGGTRPWFICPDCGRRAAILYKHHMIACRQCHNLAYSSQNETDCDQAARQAGKIRKRLGWEPGILNGEGGKPKEMQWQTYYQLVARHNYYWRLFLQNMPHFGGMFR